MEHLQLFTNFDKFKITYKSYQPTRYKTLIGNYWHICEKLPFMAQVTKIQILKNGLAPFEISKEKINEYVKEFSAAKMAFLDFINK